MRLGADGPVGLEELTADGAVEQIKTGAEIVLHAVHEGDIAVESAAADGDLRQDVGENVKKIHIVERGIVARHAEQERLIDDEAVKQEVFALVRAPDAGDGVAVEREIAPRALLAWLHFLIEQRDRLALQLVLGDHRLIVDIRHERAGADEDIVAVALTEIFQIVQQIAEEKTGVLFVEAEHRAGQNVKTALLAGEVPRLACSEMVHKRLIIVLRNYSDIRYI